MKRVFLLCMMQASLLLSCVTADEEKKGTSTATPPVDYRGSLSSQERYELGNLLARHFTPNHVHAVTAKTFGTHIPYGPEDCLYHLTSFIQRCRSEGFYVTYGINDHMVLARAISPDQSKSQVDARHFLIWHENDSRTANMPVELEKESCNLYGESFFVSYF